MHYLNQCKDQKNLLHILLRASIFLMFFHTLIFTAHHPYNVTIVGNVRYASGLERIPVKLISLLKNDLNINHLAPMFVDLTDIPSEVSAIITSSDKRPGAVALLTDPLWVFPNFNFYKAVPEDSAIKIAYSMIESTEIPDLWVHALNERFDAVVVPDPWLVSVYESCGVNIPIFVLPIPLDLEPFLEMPVKQRDQNSPFIFGASAACSPGKNIELMIQAFIKEFDNDENVRLRIHSRGGSQVENINALVIKNNDNRISFTCKSLSMDEYKDLFSTFDCLLQISQGEGYSITPREAMAAGIPCIVSNNTAQMTLCDSGLVKVVLSEKPIKVFYDFYHQYLGYKFTCELVDVCKAMRDMYEHYDEYTSKAREARTWVEQFLGPELKGRYINLIRPKKIILSDTNYISDEALYTNSTDLYQKYVKFQTSSSQ